MIRSEMAEPLRVRRRKKTAEKLSDQLERKHQTQEEAPLHTTGYDGSDTTVISTGSTLLDLAISGGRFREGGIPAGILVEIFGPSGTGKTVLLCQIAGNIQRRNGRVMFHDPEARLNKQFAKMFGLDFPEIEYTVPDTVTEVFKGVRAWIPPEDAADGSPLYGVFADSLAALSTNLEMDNEAGDKMGMRRAKEFSEELRKTCRIITARNILMVCSNQVRQNLDAGPYGQRYISPGGEAIGFYSSLRLRCISARKLKRKKSIRGKEHERTIGVQVTVEVYKSSVWKPFRTAELFIIYDYGIDDIRANLTFLKTSMRTTTYKFGEHDLGRSIDSAITAVEEQGLEHELKEHVITLWSEIEENFSSGRKPRMG
jgi:protein RecA